MADNLDDLLIKFQNEYVAERGRWVQLHSENEKLQSNYNEAREELTALSHCYDELEQRLTTAVEALEHVDNYYKCPYWHEEKHKTQARRGVKRKVKQALNKIKKG